MARSGADAPRSGMGAFVSLPPPPPPQPARAANGARARKARVRRVEGAVMGRILPPSRDAGEGRSGAAFDIRFSTELPSLTVEQTERIPEEHGEQIEQRRAPGSAPAARAGPDPRAR